MDNMIMVKSASDFTLVVNVPDIPLHRTWTKRGAQFPIDRKVLLQAYYDPSVEALFNEGQLVTNDVEFLKEVGLISEEGVSKITPLTEQFMLRIIKLMPVSEVKSTLQTLTRSQLEELADYAVANYANLNLDRVDLLAKATGKNIMKAIEHLRKTQEV